MREAMVGNFPKPFGGVATTCNHLVEQLTFSGHEVVFFDRSPHDEKILPQGITEYFQLKKYSLKRLLYFVLLTPLLLINNKKTRILLSKVGRVILFKKPQRINLITALQIIANTFELIELCNNEEFDVMHGHHASPDTLCLMYFAKYYLECPFVVTVYASEFTMGEKAIWKSDAVKVCRESDAVMCISNFTRRQMLQAGAYPQHDAVVYLGVAKEHFSIPEPAQINDIIKKYDLKNNENLVLYVGWLIERKGPQVLVESLKLLSVCTWSAYLIGPDHGLKNELEEKVKNLGLSDRIKIIEEIPYFELMTFYYLASIFVFPTLSKDEGFGLVALEAMAHGLPVVASKVGAIPEVIIDKRSGLLIDPGDHNELATNLKELMSNNRLRSEMSMNAKNLAKEFTWKRTSDQVVDIYQTAVQNYDSESI